MDNRGSRFIIFLLRNPRALEGRERRQNRSTNPHRVLALRRSYNLDLDGLWGKSGNFLGHTLADTGEHGGASREDNVGVQIHTDINITTHNGLERGVSNTLQFETSQVRLEEHLWASETFVTNDNDVTIGKFEGLLESGTLGSLLHLILEIDGNKAQRLLDSTNTFTFGRGGERVATLSQNTHEVVCQVTSSQIQTDNRVRKSMTLVNGDGVCNTIT
mmetsp:Transcript_26025/g.38129  ORF Transcript_26025/g.38129 Transcript_26025/m.38129 type:complete len:217 (-) Transcript_26025:505-1155(-)